MAWAGTPTLAAVRPPVSQSAAILAAVASTVADLHEIGLVHGRLDPTHVVIGPDGRPRLCGMGGPGAGEPDPTPAHDVLALGQLIDGLLGVDVELEPIPEKRWGRRRWSGYHRRALQTLADQATDTDPARRPTARALAAAIAEAVPDARIVATGPGMAPAAPGPARFRLGPIGDPHREAADVSEVLKVDPLSAGRLTEPPSAAPPNPLGRDHRGNPPAIRVIDHPFPEVTDEPMPDDRRHQDVVSSASNDPLDALRPDVGTDPDDASETDPSRRSTAPDRGPIGDPPRPASDPQSNGAEPGSFGGLGVGNRPRSDRVDDSDASPSPDSFDDLSVDRPLDRDGSGEPNPTGRVSGASFLGLRVDRTADHTEAPARSRPAPADKRLRRPQPRSQRPADRARRAPVAAGVVLLALVAAAGWFRPDPSTSDQASTVLGVPSDRTSSVASPEPSGEALTEASAAPTTVAVPLATTAHPRSCAQADPPAADVDGDGCREAIKVNGTSISAGRVSYDIGEAGDRVAVGDWDCDGLATAGLVRPATGEVFLFDGWAGADGAVTVEATSVVPGAHDLEPDEAGPGCGGPVVRLVDQSTRRLDLSGAVR